MDAFAGTNGPGLIARSLPSLSLYARDAGLSAADSYHSSHPSFGNLTILVCEAVLEVVFVSLPGYIVARMGMFDGTAQKTVAAINLTLFTPCLIFSKLASQLSGGKLAELFIIPIILLLQTAISWISAQMLTRLFKVTKKPQKNFVIAMAVFGNSNSLPLSLVLSLSQTISGLHWDKIPDDTDNDVGARGILYLLVFSQIGQALRWSWGMNSLLRPFDEYTLEELGEMPPHDEEDSSPYKDYPDDSSTDSISGSSSTQQGRDSPESLLDRELVNDEFAATAGLEDIRPYGSGFQRTINRDGQVMQRVDSTVSRFKVPSLVETDWASSNEKGAWTWCKQQVSYGASKLYSQTSEKATEVLEMLPDPLQHFLNRMGGAALKISKHIWACMNLPLFAIIASVVVATIPPLKRFFFTPGSFVDNTISQAIRQSAGVAVPLILVVLGANLAQNTIPAEDLHNPQYRREKRNMLIASILSRMLIPVLIMTPILALIARFIPISILDDSIFIIVCFLLTGAPSALQLAQMCQVNGIFVPVISKLLVYSYVVLIFPSTLILVMLALEVVEFAKRGK